MWWTGTFQQVWTVSLLPSRNATLWAEAIDRADGTMVARDPVALIEASRSDQTAPLEWLPYLAAERSVDEFSGAWPEAQQRAIVAGSFRYHQHKGTRKSLDEALAPLGFNVRVVEWFEAVPPRAPYTFSIRVIIPDGDEWLATQRPILIRTANSAKNAHTKLETIGLVRRGPPAMVHVAGILRRKRRIRIGQIPKPTRTNQNVYTFVGVKIASRRRTRLLPRS